MRTGGNSTESDDRRRLANALRGGQPDRVLQAAQVMATTGELDLKDAARICAFLASHDDPRFSPAGARLAARLTLASRLDLDALDAVVDLVAHLPDDERMGELLRFCERADGRSTGAAPG